MACNPVLAVASVLRPVEDQQTRRHLPVSTRLDFSAPPHRSRSWHHHLKISTKMISNYMYCHRNSNLLTCISSVIWLLLPLLNISSRPLIIYCSRWSRGVRMKKSDVATGSEVLVEESRCLSGLLRKNDRFKVIEISANDARVLLFWIRDHFGIPGTVLLEKTFTNLKEGNSFDVVNIFLKLSGRVIKNCMLLVFENETIVVENEKYVARRKNHVDHNLELIRPPPLNFHCPSFLVQSSCLQKRLTKRTSST